MHRDFLVNFLGYAIVISKFKTDECVSYIHETFLIFKLETFKNFPGGKGHYDYDYFIIYFFLSSLIFDQQLKKNFRKSAGPHEQIHSPLKIGKVQASPFLPPPSSLPCRKVRGKDLLYKTL